MTAGTETLLEVHALYARQSHLIDGGDAAGWAATFAPDGIFASSTYPEPVCGTSELTAFAERFAERGRASGEVQRHVVTNLDVVHADREEIRVRAYLQIVATRRGETSRLVRMTIVRDRLVTSGGGWRIARRDVARDDA